MIFTLSQALKDRRDRPKARLILVSFALTVLWIITCLEILAWALTGAEPMTLRVNLSIDHFLLGGLWFVAILGSQWIKFQYWKAGLGLAFWGALTIVSPALVIVALSVIFQIPWNILSALLAITVWLALWWSAIIFAPVWMLEIQPGEIYLYRRANAAAGSEQLIARESPHVSSELRNKLAKFHIPVVLISSYLDYGTPEFIRDMMLSNLNMHLNRREEEKAVEKAVQDHPTASEPELLAAAQENLRREQAQQDSYEQEAKNLLTQFFQQAGLSMPIKYIAPLDRINLVWDLNKRELLQMKIPQIITGDHGKFDMEVEFRILFNPRHAKVPNIYSLFATPEILTPALNEVIQKQIDRCARQFFVAKTLQQSLGRSSIFDFAAGIAGIEPGIFTPDEKKVLDELADLLSAVGVAILPTTVICKPIMPKAFDVATQAAAVDYAAILKNTGIIRLAEAAANDTSGNLASLILLQKARSIRLNSPNPLISQSKPEPKQSQLPPESPTPPPSPPSDIPESKTLKQAAAEQFLNEALFNPGNIIQTQQGQDGVFRPVESNNNNKDQSS